MTENEVAFLVLLCECNLIQECQAVRDLLMRILVPQLTTMPGSESWRVVVVVGYLVES